MLISISCPSRIEYEDRQESLLRALQQNVTRETQMVRLAITFMHDLNIQTELLFQTASVPYIGGCDPAHQSKGQI